MSVWKSMFDQQPRQALLDRIVALEPGAPARWGRMTVQQMVCHLSDQMRLAVEAGAPETPARGTVKQKLTRNLVIYVLPWPKGKVEGPPEGFVTQPASWDDDIAGLCELVERFGTRSPTDHFPGHPMFGSMSGRDWGVFSHKHFNHHLSQFGV